MKKVVSFILIVIVIASGSLMGCVVFQGGGGSSQDDPGLEPSGDLETQFQTFSTFEEVKDFISGKRELDGNSGYLRYLDSSYRYYGYYDLDSDGFASAPSFSHPSNERVGSNFDEYSTTNVQEAGVDEGDIVKNNGEYAYILSGDGSKVCVVRVYPPGSANIVSEIDVEGSIREFYLRGDRLVIISTTQSFQNTPFFTGSTRDGSRLSGMLVNIYDVSNENNLALSRQYGFQGYIEGSRMIGDDLYIVGYQYTNTIETEDDLPVPASDVYYIDEYDRSYRYTGVTSINIHGAYQPKTRLVLLGSSSEIYVSTSNIYLTHQKVLSTVERKEMEIEQVILSLLPADERGDVEEIIGSNISRGDKLSQVNSRMGEYITGLTDSQRETFYQQWRFREDEFLEDIAPMFETTAVHRVSVNNGEISFKASGEVPGYILNRFSMGEYDGYFRIATTTGHVWKGENSAKNHMFVMDMQLRVVGSINDIAPNERIYSARFIGHRAYLVTFQKVDPFFVIDLKDPFDPKILGELKIPGYSDYLHPYDENHVIGLGKETVEAEGGDFSWYQGVKLSLFDVRDLNDPKERAKFVIGDRGTSSIAQSEPHAFLFSLSKNLLVLPISLCEIDRSQYPGIPPAHTSGDHVWEGAYVFKVTPEGGFELKGRISHGEELDPEDHYHGVNGDTVFRSFYIRDIIYTVSLERICGHRMDNIDQVMTVDLPYEEEDPYYYYFD